MKKMERTVKYSNLGVSPLSVGLWLCLIPTRRVKKTGFTSFIFDRLKAGREPLNLNKEGTFK
jgi:hypothetical protein